MLASQRVHVARVYSQRRRTGMRENDKGGKEDEKGSKSAADIWAITSNQEKWTQVRCKVKGSWGPNRIEALKKRIENRDRNRDGRD